MAAWRRFILWRWARRLRPAPRAALRWPRGLRIPPGTGGGKGGKKGRFTVAARLTHPTWYGPGKVVPPGKSNPLGPRWIGLSRKGYGIHGTSNPRSIGRPASHGCIRMRNSDVEELFGLVAVGDPVELYAERTGEVARILGVPAAVTQVAANRSPAAAGMSGGQ